MGLGLYEQGSGVAAAKFFASRGAQVLVTDLRSKKDLKSGLDKLSGFKNIKYILGQHRISDFKAAEIVFQNPSVPDSSPYLVIARRRGIPIINDWTIFLSQYQPKIFIGVTGTRGKSTTTALLYEMVKKWKSKVRLAGNIGVSPLSFIDKYKGEPVVAELSSWLLRGFKTIQKSPPVAVLTNILNDHLDKYPAMREYIADKENIFKFQKAGDTLISNWDNQCTRKIGKKLICHSNRSEESHAHACTHLCEILRRSVPQDGGQRVIWFSLKKHLPKWVPLKTVKLLGSHNLQNVLAACAAAEAVGVPRRHILAVIKTFRGLPSRLELVRIVGGVSFYNDTTATTPDATIAAFISLAPLEIKNIVLICGGADKKLEFRELAKYIKRYCKAAVLLPGTATEKIRLLIARYRLPVTEVRDMDEAVKTARAIAVKGDIVLLSPGAASFGIFKNEFDRGGQFVKVVRSL